MKIRWSECGTVGAEGGGKVGEGPIIRYCGGDQLRRIIKSAETDTAGSDVIAPP